MFIHIFIKSPIYQVINSTTRPPPAVVSYNLIHLWSGIDGEFELGLLAEVDGQTLHEQ